MDNTNTDPRSARLKHIKGHLEVDRSNAIYNVTNRKGSPPNSARSLAGNALANAMYAWFSDRDLKAAKQWAYVSGMLNKLVYQLTENEDSFTYSPGGKMLQLLTPLLSDNQTLMDWFVDFDKAYDQKRVENHKTRDFWAYQTIIALRGDWTRLLERSETVLADPPGASSERKYQDDHHFHLALAKGDVAGMEVALRQIVLPKALAARKNDESGFTEDLISTPAFIYAKIAWRHGYEVSIDSPSIPREWLPIAPIDHYDNHYTFFG